MDDREDVALTAEDWMSDSLRLRLRCGKKETALGHRRGKWWHDHYPRLVSGEAGDELPETWSPAPEYVEDD